MRRLRHRRNLCTGQLHTNWLAKTVAQMVEREKVAYPIKIPIKRPIGNG